MGSYFLKLDRQMLNIFAVFTVLTTSGAGIINTIWLLVLAVAMIVFLNPTLTKKAFDWIMVWCGVLTVNTVFGGGGDIAVNEVLVMILRIICTAIVLSNISLRGFLSIFIKILEPLAILSLVCMGILLIAPGLLEPISIISGSIKGTLFHVFGFANETVYTRNCSIFWEPGVYQIYLNLAIMLLIFNQIKDVEHRNRKIIIFSIALLTTQSSMGLLCMAITLFAASIINEDSQNKSAMRGVAIFLLIVLVIIEVNYSIVGYKLIQGEGSFSSRIEDLRISASITRVYPLFGTGLFRDFSSIWTRHRENLTANFWGVLANSNGLGASFFKMGVPFTLIHMSFLFRNYYKLCDKKLILAILFFINTILFFVNEPIVFVPFWIAMASWAFIVDDCKAI